MEMVKRWVIGNCPAWFRPIRDGLYQSVILAVLTAAIAVLSAPELVNELSLKGGFTVILLNAILGYLRQIRDRLQQPRIY